MSRNTATAEAHPPGYALTMEPFGLVVIVVGIAAVAAVIWWFARRRRADMLEYDEAPASDEPVQAPPQVLSRDALINPNRHLDPTKWDLPGDDDIEGELPTHFDRDYLRRQQD